IIRERLKLFPKPDISKLAKESSNGSASEPANNEKFYAPRPTGPPARSQGSRPFQSQLRRHRASAARIDQARPGRGRERFAKDGARPRDGADGSRKTSRLRSGNKDRRQHPLHPACEKGFGSGREGSEGAQSFLRRHRAHSAWTFAGGRRSGRTRAQEARDRYRAHAERNSAGARSKFHAIRSGGKCRTDFEERCQNSGPPRFRPRPDRTREKRGARS